MNSKNYKRAVDMLCRESISTAKSDDLELRNSTRVVPLRTALMIIQEYQEGTLEKFYQENQKIIDRLRPPEIAKEIMKSLNINLEE